MRKSHVLALLLVIVTVLSSVVVFADPGTDIRLNITMGIGEKRPVANYLRNESQVVWKSQNNTIAAVAGTDIVAKKLGTTIIEGDSGSYKYTIVVKVLESVADAVVSTEKKSDAVHKSDGSSISYKDVELSVGIGDKVDINGLLPKSYSNYLWRIGSGEKFLKYSKGVISGVKEGIVKLTAAGNTSSTKNSIVRFYITVDSNVISKYIKLSKSKSYNLNAYIGDAENFAITVKSGSGSTVTVENGILTTPNSSGTSVVCAESLIGEKNYTLIFKTM